MSLRTRTRPLAPTPLPSSIRPTVWLAIDGSASIAEQRDPATHWAWIRSALLDAAQGVVHRSEQRVRWGLWIYSGKDPSGTIPDAGVQGCPELITLDPERGNFAAIASVYPAGAPGGTSPTHLALEQLLARLQQPGSGHTPGATHIALVTDGVSNDLCAQDPMAPLGAGSDVTARVVEATRKLREAGATLHVVSVDSSNVNAQQQLDAVAQASGGGSFAASNAVQLQRALEEIVHVGAACDLALDGRATSADPCGAEVRIAGQAVACNESDGFRVVHPQLVRLHGAGCVTAPKLSP